jgi:transposase
MAEPTTPGCPHCQRLQAEVERLTTRRAALEAELAKARKHSGNSSKPPSSDITTPPRSQPGTASTGKRKRGGQPGHPRHQRLPFDPQQLTATVPY